MRLILFVVFIFYSNVILAEDIVYTHKETGFKLPAHYGELEFQGIVDYRKDYDKGLGISARYSMDNAHADVYIYNMNISEINVDDVKYQMSSAVSNIYKMEYFNKYKDVEELESSYLEIGKEDFAKKVFFTAFKFKDADNDINRMSELTLFRNKGYFFKIRFTCEENTKSCEQGAELIAELLKQIM